MARFFKFILVGLVVFLAVAVLDYFVFKKEDPPADEPQPADQPGETVRVEKISPAEITEQTDKYKIEIVYPVTGKESIDSRVLECVGEKAEEIKSEALSFSQEAERPEGLEPEYVLEMDYEVFSPNTQVVSFKFDGYQFTGGAHGIGVLKTMIFDLETGCEYILSDIFRGESAYLQKLSRLSREQLKKEEKLGDLYDEFMVNPGTAPEVENFKNFVLTKEGIIIFFEDYQVAPYAAGEQKVEFTYSEFEEELKASFDNF